MRIIELNEEQFKEYVKIHSKKNYFQTIEYANMQEKYNFKKIYVGLIDDDSNIVAGSLLLTNTLKGKYAYAYAPRGFLIDFFNKELLTIWTKELTKFLKKLKVVFVKVDPLILYKEWDKDNNLIKSNAEIMPFLKSLGYIHLGFNKYFESNNSRYNVILKTTNSIEDTYKKISRNAKRNIEDNYKRGISIHKGSIENIDLFYSIIRKKTNKDIEYYKNYMKYYNSGDYKVELYFAKINPKQYIENYRYLLNQEISNNNIINNLIQDKNTKQTDNLFNKKILSDKLIENYNSEIINATNIYSRFPNGLVVGTCAIIKDDNEITFLIDGYEEKTREIQSSYMLKWEIIKKYLLEGYTKFNLGEITGDVTTTNNKYYGLYFSKMSFNGTVYEYPGEFDLIVNKPIYKLYYNIMHYKSKF